MPSEIQPTSSQLGRRRFRIRGMDCADEIAALRKALLPISGVKSVEADLVDGILYVEAPAEVADAIIVSAIEKTGMGAHAVAGSGRAVNEAPSRRWVGTAIGGAMLAAGLVSHLAVESDLSTVLSEDSGEGMPWLTRVFYGAAVVTSARTVVPRALAAARRIKPDMNLLMTIAVFGAIAIGQWFEAATVSFLFSLSLSLESWSVRRARRAISALLDVGPTFAKLVSGNGPGSTRKQSVPAREVTVGSHVAIDPGDRVPLDGRILDGRSELNEAPITGEAKPVEKGPGQDVFAGSVNGDGALTIETTRPYDDTLVARIVRLVGEARAQRGAAQRFVDRFAAIYTPIVLAVALLMATVMPLLTDGNWRAWLYQSLVVLVISCPCALVISTPVSIVCGLARAARAGVLVKGAEFVEALATIRAVAVDKTGTITVGRPDVVEVLPATGVSELRLLEIAAAVESTSSHPLAKAIVDLSIVRGIKAPHVEGAAIVKGRGATATIGGIAAWVGSHRMLDEKGGEEPSMHEAILRLEAEGRTIAAVGFGETLLGVLALSDVARPEAVVALRDLRAAGIHHIAMLTGDHPASAQAIAAAVGIEDVRAPLLPEEKIRAVEEMLGRWKSVAMVGDGANDAPSLARATVGISMGISGSGAAIETSDVTLMHDDLSMLPWIVRFARKVRRTIRFNIAAALLVKAIFVVLALLGNAQLWSAIAADMGVSLAVVANALRLLGYPPPTSTRRR